MPDTDSVTLVKSFEYRGATEEWSNTYHLSGTTPTDDAGWDTLIKAIWASEKTILGGAVKLVRGYGYQSSNEHSVAQLDYSAGFSGNVGTLLSTGGLIEPPGDVAVMLRARVGLSTKGKKVYVRKYFHGSYLDPSNQDKVAATAIAAMTAHGGKMLDGTLPGSMKWVGPQGAVPTTPQGMLYATTRTLKRRGKRP